MNILKSVGSYGGLTIISRVLGYLRDILIAIFIGTSYLADAFFVAFRLPNTFRRLFAEGSFNSAFIPMYTKYRSNRQSYVFANSIFNFLLLILLGIVFLCEIFMGGVMYLISPGFVGDTNKFEVAKTLSRITFPFLLFVSLSSFLSAILNSNNKFAASAAAPIILNIFFIISIFISNYYDKSFVHSMSLAVFFSGIIQFLILLFCVRKYFLPTIGFKFLNLSYIKDFFKRILPSIFSSGIMQINILVGTIIASFQSSAVSYLYYADRVYQLPLALTGIAVGTVILPVLSKSLKSDTDKNVKFLQNRSVELSLFLSAPAAAGLVIGSEQIISCLFGYGSFDIKSINQTSKALVIFGYGLPAFSLLKLYSNFYFARGNTKFPFHVSIVTVMLNIVISVLFFNTLGFVSIAYGTTVSCWISIIIYKFYLKKDNYYTFDRIFIERFSKIFVCTLIMGSILYFQFFYFSHGFDTGSVSKLLYLIFIISSSIIVYFTLSILFKSFSIRDFRIKRI